MIPLVGFGEDAADFPSQCSDMRPADSAALRAGLAAALDLTDVRYIARGYNNSHHAGRARDGRQVVVRRVLAPVAALERRLAREWAVLAHLDQAGFPHAPRPVRWLNAYETGGAPGFVMTHCAGMSPESGVATAAALGAAVAALHALPVPEAVASLFPVTDPVVLLGRTALTWRRHLDVVGASFPEAPRRDVERVATVLRDAIAGLPWCCTSRCLVHGDLGEHNVLSDAVTGDLALIDFEFAAVTDPTLDFMWLLARKGFDEATTDAFFLAYEERIGAAIPACWHARLPALRAMSLVELVLWAQGGLLDIASGINSHYFRPGDEEELRAQVDRLPEALAIAKTLSRGFA
jgi:aminoglycoside phosphotransferase (APT) family kinase protein